MSASQFDDLLGDFGDSSSTSMTVTTTTTKTTTNGSGSLMDDFDPFGPSHGETNMGGDSGLLLDFSTDAEIRNGETSNGVDFQLDGTTSTTITTTTSSNSSTPGTANPFSDMSSHSTQFHDSGPTNPLYDLADEPAHDQDFGGGDGGGGSANPLYDLSGDFEQQESLEVDTNQSANPLYNLAESSSPVGEQHQPVGTNPLYDFEDVDNINNDNIANQQQLEEQQQFGDAEEDEGGYHQHGGMLQDQFADQEEEEEQQMLSAGHQDVLAEFDQVVGGPPADLVMNGEAHHWVSQSPEPTGEVEYVEEDPTDKYGYGTVETYVEETPNEPEPEPEPQAEPEPEPEPEPMPEQQIPSVEITTSGEQNQDPGEVYGQEEHSYVEQLPDLVVKEEGDVVEEEEEDKYHEHVDAHEEMEEAIPTQDTLNSDSFGHDRREVDLEHYCMDREESDLTDELHPTGPPPHEEMASLKPREERSRSPSRSIGPDMDAETSSPDMRTPDNLSEDSDVPGEGGLRPREDRSHAPSRSLEREEPKPQEQEIVSRDGGSVTTSKTTRTETRYSGSGLDNAQITSDQFSSRQYDRNQQNNREEQEQADMLAMKTTSGQHKTVDVQQEVLSTEGGVYENQPKQFEQWKNPEEEEEGVYESTPIKRDNVAREADRDLSADLPAVGTAQSMRAKFLEETQKKQETRSKREITPPAHGAGGEYVSEPRGHVERYEGRPDAGVFESQPQAPADVITSYDTVEDAKPEQGFARNVAARFKEMESQAKVPVPSSRKELTPERDQRVEFVSEPRQHSFETYEGKPESGVFESQPQINPEVVRSGEGSEEPLPERGTAKNLANRYKQMVEESVSPPSASNRNKRELTPDTSGRVEYVSEPRGQHMDVQQTQMDAGVFENQPQRNADVITSDSYAEDYVPERGYTRNVAAKFREMESSMKSPPLSPGRQKEFTPPREDVRMKQQNSVLENEPEYKAEVIHSDDTVEEMLPERGTAKNMAQRFRQLAEENASPASSRQKKEITPPPQNAGGVFENQPKQVHYDYNPPAESGILENKPVVREDVVRANEPKYEEELPERGAAKNLVSKWKQMESESAKTKSPNSGRVKEFTPPREEPRIAEQRKSPRTPKSPTSHDQMDNGSVHPHDLPGQYQPQNEPSVFESSPQSRRDDIVREDDTDWLEGMPKKDTAKKMLARFQNIQAEANKKPAGPDTAKNVRHQ